MSVLEAPGTVETAAPMAVAAPDNRMKLVAVGALAVVLLVVAALFVPKLLSGNSGDSNSPVTPAARKPSAKAAAAPAAKKPVAKAKAKAAPLKVRDPFKPLYVEPKPVADAAPATSSAGSTGTTATTAGTTTAGTTTAGTTTTTTTGTTAGTTTTTTGTTTGTTTPATGTTTVTAPVGATKISLIAVATTGGKLRASTTVNSVLYTPAAGESFAKSYKLVGLAGSCGTYLYGDQKFALCVGQYIVH